MNFEWTPLNIKACLYKDFHMCGCSDTEETIKSIRKIMEWCAMDSEKKFCGEDLYPETGVFYLLIGLLTDMDFASHGSSVRFSWLDPAGEQFLEALQKYTPDEIEAATGEAYDGLDYS